MYTWIVKFRRSPERSTPIEMMGFQHPTSMFDMTEERRKSLAAERVCNETGLVGLWVVALSEVPPSSYPVYI